MLNPASYFSGIQKRLLERRLRRDPNLRGAVAFPPGHFYSPLLDLRNVQADTGAPFDGPEYWEHIDLRPSPQRSFYEELLSSFPPLPFPTHRTPEFRFYSENDWFGPSDAFVLSALLRKEQPRRIIEIGSGFSSAVMLDTLDRMGASAVLTFIEPHPERLHALLSEKDKAMTTILPQPAQEVSLSVFDQLEAHDLLFIDSSHVCKIGSDVAHILLRIVPRLKPGVLVHFHDIFYPFSYPTKWIREGRAWNESLFLRAFLVGNSQFEIVAFNALAKHSFPEIFRDRFPDFLKAAGSSLWLRSRERVHD